MRGARALGRMAALGLAVGVVLASGTPAGAADQATISHVEPTEAGVNILVSVPADSNVDLDSVAVTISGQDADATATLASSGEEVRRTAVLAIDTSNSMKGARFAAAKSAAEAYLSAVPDNVYVGIVTFDDNVKRALEPTLDRDAARETLAGLTLAKQTVLYDGVLEAVDMTGTEGQRSVLVLSDGLDTSKTELAEVTTAITDADVLVDAVALEQSEQESGPLQAMASAGKGKLINSDPETLRATFSAEAAALARQVLVSAQIPEGVTAREAQVTVSLGAGAQTLTAQAFVPIQGAAGPGSPSASSSTSRFQVSETVMYGGLAALGLGMLILLAGVLTMGPTASEADSMEARISQFTSGVTTGKRKASKDQDLRAQATDAAAQMLQHSQSLEARIANRLEAAGSALKPSEWLLIHGAIAIGSAFVGLMLAGGLGLLLGLAVGAVFPWVWLGFKRSRRLKAFNASLADSLQLMAGSLSAGLSLAQSVDTIVKEGTEPMTSEFKRVLVETRLGVNLEDALDGVSDRMQSKDFSWVVMAIRIQREVGGNLAELLTTVAATLRERQYLRRQVATLSAEGRLSAWILGGLPPGFMAYLMLTRRDYVMPMFTEPFGLLMLIGSGVLLGVGIFWMSKVVKVEV